MRRDAWVGEADMGRQIAEIPFRMRWFAIIGGFVFGAGMLTFGALMLMSFGVEALIFSVKPGIILVAGFYILALVAAGILSRLKQRQVLLFEDGIVIPRLFRRPLAVTLPAMIEKESRSAIGVIFGPEGQRVGLGVAIVSRADFETIVDHLRVLEERSEVLIHDRALRVDFLCQAIKRNITKMEAGLLDPNDLDWGDPELEEIAAWSDEQWNALMRGERLSEATPEATDAA